MSRKWVRWILGVSLLGLLLFGPGLYEIARLSVMQRRLDRQLIALTREHERLAQEQERFHADPTYVEGLIRSTFKMAKPGELVIPLDPQSSRHKTQ